MSLKIDIWILADVSENFRKTCLETYQLDPAKFLSAPGKTGQAALKKTEVKLELLTNIDMLLMVERRIRGGICHSINRYAKVIINIWKITIKINNPSALNIATNNFYDWAMSQNLSINDFKWVDMSEFDKILKKVMKYVVLKLISNTQENYIKPKTICHFYLKELKSKKSKRLLLTYLIKLNMLFTWNFLKSIKSWISFEKKFRFIKLNQVTQPTPYIDMNNNSRKAAKKGLRERIVHHLLNE